MQKGREQPMTSSRVYYAGPLFSLGERAFNELLACALRRRLPDIELQLPQQYAKTVAGQPRFADRVFQHCIDSIDKADVVVAILDGADADSGTCIELGYAYARGKPIVGLRTDPRDSEDMGLNIMVSKVCHELVSLTSADLTIDHLADQIASAILRMRSQDDTNP